MPSSSCPSAYSSTYTTENIIGLPCKTLVKAGSTTLAQTNVTYDGSSLSAASGFTHHDDTNYGSTSTVRGNPTQIQRWVSGSTYVTTTLSYDTTGQVTQTTDANGNPTNFTYSNQNAYVSQIKNALNQTTNLGYDPNLGLLTSVQDANSQTTTFGYDSMNRLTSSGFPDGGSVQTTYASATQIDAYTKLTSTTQRQDETVLNALGKVITQKLVSDPAGADLVSTTYDTSGRVSMVSNPYRSTSDPTYGLQTLAYDGLNRVVSVTHADGNSIQTAYGAGVSASGVGGRSTQSCATGLGYPLVSTDEAGKKRQVWTDALGRVVEVDEPDPASGSLTGSGANFTCYSYEIYWITSPG